MPTEPYVEETICETTGKGHEQRGSRFSIILCACILSMLHPTWALTMERRTSPIQTTERILQSGLTIGSAVDTESCYGDLHSSDVNSDGKLSPSEFLSFAQASADGLLDTNQWGMPIRQFYLLPSEYVGIYNQFACGDPNYGCPSVVGINIDGVAAALDGEGGTMPVQQQTFMFQLCKVMDQAEKSLTVKPTNGPTLGTTVSDGSTSLNTYAPTNSPTFLSQSYSKAPTKFPTLTSAPPSQTPSKNSPLSSNTTYPTSSGPPPCPPLYDSTASYSTGDLVSQGEVIYQCQPLQWCGQVAYTPGTTLADWSLAWMSIGQCDEEESMPKNAPTKSPTSDSGLLTSAPTVPNLRPSTAAPFSRLTSTSLTPTVSSVTEVTLSPTVITVPPTSKPVDGGARAGDNPTTVPTSGPTLADQQPEEGTVPPTIPINQQPSTYAPTKTPTKTTVTPTSDPPTSSLPPCPPLYNDTAPYDAGDLVSYGELYYQCRPFPQSGWCSQAAYKPGNTLVDWSQAWTLIGGCRSSGGEVSPVSAPTKLPTLDSERFMPTTAPALSSSSVLAEANATIAPAPTTAVPVTDLTLPSGTATPMEAPVFQMPYSPTGVTLQPNPKPAGAVAITPVPPISNLVGGDEVHYSGPLTSTFQYEIYNARNLDAACLMAENDTMAVLLDTTTQFVEIVVASTFGQIRVRGRARTMKDRMFPNLFESDKGGRRRRGLRGTSRRRLQVLLQQGAVTIDNLEDVDCSDPDYISPGSYSTGCQKVTAKTVLTLVNEPKNSTILQFQMAISKALDDPGMAFTPESGIAYAGPAPSWSVNSIPQMAEPNNPPGEDPPVQEEARTPLALPMTFVAAFLGAIILFLFLADSRTRKRKRNEIELQGNDSRKDNDILNGSGRDGSTSPHESEASSTGSQSSARVVVAGKPHRQPGDGPGPSNITPDQILTSQSRIRSADLSESDSHSDSSTSSAEENNSASLTASLKERQQSLHVMNEGEVSGSEWKRNDSRKDNNILSDNGSGREGSTPPYESEASSAGSQSSALVVVAEKQLLRPTGDDPDPSNNYMPNMIVTSQSRIRSADLSESDSHSDSSTSSAEEDNSASLTASLKERQQSLHVMNESEVPGSEWTRNEIELQGNDSRKDNDILSGSGSGSGSGREGSTSPYESEASSTGSQSSARVVVAGKPHRQPGDGPGPSNNYMPNMIVTSQSRIRSADLSESDSHSDSSTSSAEENNSASLTASLKERQQSLHVMNEGEVSGSEWIPNEIEKDNDILSDNSSGREGSTSPYESEASSTGSQSSALVVVAGTQLLRPSNDMPDLIFTPPLRIRSADLSESDSHSDSSTSSAEEDNSAKSTSSSEEENTASLAVSLEERQQSLYGMNKGLVFGSEDSLRLSLHEASEEKMPPFELPLIGSGDKSMSGTVNDKGEADENDDESPSPPNEIEGTISGLERSLRESLDKVSEGKTPRFELPLMSGSNKNLSGIPDDKSPSPRNDILNIIHASQSRLRSADLSESDSHSDSSMSSSEDDTLASSSEEDTLASLTSSSEEDALALSISSTEEDTGGIDLDEICKQKGKNMQHSHAALAPGPDGLVPDHEGNTWRRQSLYELSEENVSSLESSLISDDDKPMSEKSDNKSMKDRSSGTSMAEERALRASVGALVRQASIEKQMSISSTEEDTDVIDTDGICKQKETDVQHLQHAHAAPVPSPDRLVPDHEGNTWLRQSLHTVSEENESPSESSLISDDDESKVDESDEKPMADKSDGKNEAEERVLRASVGALVRQASLQKQISLSRGIW